MRDRFGAFARDDSARGLELRHDHDGGQSVSHDFFQAEIRFPGIASSPGFVREPGGILGLDPRTSAERFIRIPKEDLSWVRRFATLEEPRLALHEFRATDDRTWIIERHGDRTPAQVRAERIGHSLMAA